MLQLFRETERASRVAEEALDAVQLGVQRSLTQDVAFGVDQLTDIALRALSPGSTTRRPPRRRCCARRTCCDGWHRDLGRRIIEGERLLAMRT